ncbi:MAG: carbohydrate kinase family protein [Anaerolineae bacterium]|nr:carbohydrate kinase family protein [Anaerolineae bacterium]
MNFDYDFLGVGGLALDLALQVEQLPLADEKYPAQLTGKLPGGFIANATCAAARLGLRAAYVGCVGDDAEGELLRADFVARGVDTAGLVTVPGEPTPFTVVVTDQQGHRAILLPSFALYRADLTPDQLALARRAQIVYTFPRDLAWCQQLHAATQDSGGALALDVETAISLPHADLLAAIRLAGIVFFTEASFAAFDRLAPQTLIQPGQIFVITAGNRGASAWQTGMAEPIFRPARVVEKVVDTTGAGDCFHAAFMAAHGPGADLPATLEFAHAAAALKVRHAGARGGLPTRAEVETLLNAD